TKADAALFAEGKSKSDAGDLAAAIAIFDRLLTQDPARAERAQMVATYLARADQLEDSEDWGEAAAMFSKAHGLDPTGPTATDALAAQHYALGKALEKDGKDGSAEYRKAVELRPDYAEAQEAAKAAAP